MHIQSSSSISPATLDPPLDRGLPSPSPPPRLAPIPRSCDEATIHAAPPCAACTIPSLRLRGPMSLARSAASLVRRSTSGLHPAHAATCSRPCDTQKLHQRSDSIAPWDGMSIHHTGEGILTIVIGHAAGWGPPQNATISHGPAVQQPPNPPPPQQPTSSQTHSIRSLPLRHPILSMCSPHE